MSAKVLLATNAKVQAVTAIMDGLRNDGLVSKTPFAEPIAFDELDTWHYYGRTAKHGAFMGGADLQWCGNCELLRMSTRIERAAADLRAARPRM